MKNFNIKQTGNSLFPILTLLLLVCFLSIFTDAFLKMNNLLNILRQASINALVSFGMLFVLLTGGIDLSIGATIAFSGCVMGTLLRFGISNSFVLICSGLLCGCFIGLLNGMIFTKLDLPHPFVSTMGMQLVVRGICLWLADSSAMTGFSEGVTFLGSKQIAGFPLCFLLVLLMAVIFTFILNRTAFGCYIYSIGGNPEAAKLSGIRVKELLTVTYILSGFFAALAGIVMIGRVGVIYPTAGEGYEMNAVAACVVGGASFKGGHGSIAGTLVGTLVIEVLNNGLNLLDVQSAIRKILLGMIIVSAVFLDAFRTKREKQIQKYYGTNG